MDRFSKYNPKVTFLFFILVFIFTLSFFHPIFVLISFIAALGYKFKLDGRKTFFYLFKFILPIIFLITLFNFIFAHYGVTTLFTVHDIYFTLESMFYGLCQGTMFGAVIIWFSCYSMVVTSECFISIFGRFAPNIALVFSMVLSFIPRFRKNAQEINDARMLLDCEHNRLRKSISNFSALVTLTLEESIETADSMKARGFGKGRTVYSKYKFSLSDGICMAVMIVLSVLLIVFKFNGSTQFLFEPVIKMTSFPLIPMIIFAITMFLPMIIDFEEDIRWHFLKQKV